MSGGSDHQREKGRGDPENHARRAHNQLLPTASGAGKLLFVDAFSGIAGDMLVGALLDLGVPMATIKAALDPLPLSGYEIQTERVERSGIAACRFWVSIEGNQPSRHWPAIRSLLEAASPLPGGARQLALRAFEILARAEAEVHGTDSDAVHFHEVGAVDSIVDMVAAAVALDHLGARVVGSPLPLGRGFVQTRHGCMPAPAPATVLCLRGIPTHDAGIDGELVTPTGAALLTAAASDFARWPVQAERDIQSLVSRIRSP